MKNQTKNNAWFNFLKVVLICCSIAFAPSCQNSRPGTKNRPFRIMFFPNTNDTLKRSTELISEYIQKQTKLKVEPIYPVDYLHAAKLFNSKKIDLAFMNNYSYFLIESKNIGDVHLRVIRGNKTSHKAQIITRSDSGIEKITDLRYKRVAFVDRYSISGFVLAASMLIDKNIKVEPYFVGSHLEVVRQVLNKEVDAGSTYVDSRGTSLPNSIYSVLKSKHKNMQNEVKSIIQTAEIPSEPVVLRNGIDQDIVNKVISALLSLPSEEKYKKALLKMTGISGFKRASHKDYELLRKKLNQIKKHATKYIPGGFKELD